MTVNPMQKAHDAPRCGAKTRRGTPCQSPMVRDRKRCRMHGGAYGSGAPKGNRNAWKHGLRSKKYLAGKRRGREIIRKLKDLMNGVC
jgi:hypothetical protein